MTDDKLRGCWDFASDSVWSAPEEISKARKTWLTEYFHGTPPPYIWRAEFFEDQPGIYTMVLHRFASNIHNGRYGVWARVYDATGTAQSVRVPAVEAPETFALTAANPPSALPPEDLLLGVLPAREGGLL
jgi:hypothetical protein